MNKGWKPARYKRATRSVNDHVQRAWKNWVRILGYRARGRTRQPSASNALAMGHDRPQTLLGPIASVFDRGATERSRVQVGSIPQPLVRARFRRRARLARDGSKRRTVRLGSLHEELSTENDGEVGGEGGDDFGVRREGRLSRDPSLDRVGQAGERERREERVDGSGRRRRHGGGECTSGWAREGGKGETRRGPRPGDAEKKNFSMFSTRGFGLSRRPPCVQTCCTCDRQLHSRNWPVGADASIREQRFYHVEPHILEERCDNTRCKAQRFSRSDPETGTTDSGATHSLQKRTTRVTKRAEVTYLYDSRQKAVGPSPYTRLDALAIMKPARSSS